MKAVRLDSRYRLDYGRVPYRPGQSVSIGANFHRSFRVAPAKAGHPRDSLTVTYNVESLTTITDLGAGSAQAGDCCLSHLTCSVGSLMLAENITYEV